GRLPRLRQRRPRPAAAGALSMPARQPFTHLCQQAARLPHTGRADLHLHSTSSDGEYTPAQVVELAWRAGLAAIALTDHDTLAGDAAARAAQSGCASAAGLEVIAGVEITTEYQGRELHLLAYFVEPGNAALERALATIALGRRARFGEMLDRLRQRGVEVDDE